MELAENTSYAEKYNVSTGFYFAVYRFAGELFGWDGRDKFIEWCCVHPQEFDEMVSCGHAGKFKPTSYNYHMFINFWHQKLVEELFEQANVEDYSESLAASAAGRYAVPQDADNYISFIDEMSRSLGVKPLADTWMHGVPLDDISA